MSLPAKNEAERAGGGLAGVPPQAARRGAIAAAYCVGTGTLV